MVIFIGCDPETTPWGFIGQAYSRLCYWWRELGIKQVYIYPDLNYGAAVHADKWIPVLPNTDAALLLAIAYTWITESTYDKAYLATHAYRGIVLGGAYATERIISGAVSQDHGARHDPITTGLDRGGSNNFICPANTTSKNACGMATNGYLVEVEKVSSADMEAWRTRHPEAFKREYDTASGLHLNAWVEESLL
jgi:anaerobic selenocysteine-containing dehydrogenase